MRRAVFSILCMFIGVAAAIVTAEMACRVLPVYAGLQPHPDAAAWPLRAYAPGKPYAYSFGWAMRHSRRGVTNNYGHIAAHDFRAGSKPVIVVGDSYVESLMNPHADTLQGLLGERLSGLPVYGLGLSGMSASDYVVMARLARREFEPRAAVFVITDGDFAGNFVPRPGGFHLERRGQTFEPVYTPRSPSRAVQRVREALGGLALYDYVRGNLKFAPADVFAGLRLSAVTPPAATRPVSAAVAEGIEVVRWFLDELPSATGAAAQCTVLLLDTDRFALYRPADASATSDAPQVRRALIEQAQARGFRVVDLGPPFAAEYARTRLKLDFWPLDRHWNRQGHSVAADAAAAALLSAPQGGRCDAVVEGNGAKP